MPVSLCEWRVRIGTFVHWIRDYEIRERKERWLKERTRILKVLCERLKAKKSDSELEKEEDDENAAENRQEGSNPTKSRQCPHKTNIKSSGSFDIKDLITSCDQCIHDLLTPSHCCSKDLITPSDGCIKEFLEPPDSTVKDLITPNNCIVKDLINQNDCSVKDLTTPDDCRVKDLVTPDYCSVKDLITPDHCSVKDLITPDHCGVKDLTTPGDCSFKALLTSEECSVKDLIAPPDCGVKNLNTSKDCSVKDLITPDDCTINVKDLISPDDCSIKALLTAEGYSVKDLITPHDCSVEALITPDDCSVKYLITPQNCSVKDLNTSKDCSVKDPITPQNCSVKDLIAPHDCSVKSLITPDDCNVKDLITPHDCSVKALITPDDCSVKDLITPDDFSVKDLITPQNCSVKDLIRPDDVSAKDLHTSHASTPVGGKSSVIAEYISRPFCNDERRGKTKEHGRSTSLCHGPSLKSKTALIPEQTPPISELLLLKSGDVELNPGPREWPDLELERELMSLIDDISPEYYSVLCNSLGFGRAQSQSILSKNLLDVPKSLFEIICSWGVKQRDGTDRKKLLADKLRSVHLDALGAKLLKGGYLPQENPFPDGGQLLDQLTPEQVERCGQDFRTFYRTRMCTIKTDPLDFEALREFETIYTNLVLLRNEMGTRKMKTSLEYDDLLTTKVNDEFSKRLMVQGEGGSGKTTFCSKIAWDWSNGHKAYKQFDWVIVIPMREIQRGQSVGDIAKTYLSDSNMVQPGQINDYILSQPSKVFLILDGLDEYGGNILEDESDFGKIIRSEKYKECTILITSRPWKASRIKSRQDLCKIYTFIGVEGFSPQNVSSYITKYFVDDEIAGAELIQFIEENEVVKMNMAPFPIYVAMLCILWRESTNERREMIRKLKTFSQLFHQMITFLTEHFISKSYDNTTDRPSTEIEQIDTFLVQVGEIAFSGLLEKQLMFDENVFDLCKEAMDMCTKIGVLSREKRFVPRFERRGIRMQPTTFSVSFPHKLFQEYLAALYLASLYNSNIEEYRTSIDNVLRGSVYEFEYLIYFTSSLGKSVGLDIIERLIHNDCEDDFLVDVAFEADDPDTGKVVGEKVFAEGKSLSINDQMPAHTLSGYLFIMEKHAMETLILSDRSCGPTVSRDFADVLSSPSSLTTLTLTGTTLHDDFFRFLHKHVSASKGEKCINSLQKLHIDHRFINALQKFDISIDILFPRLKQLWLDTSQTVSPDIIKRLAHSNISVFKIGLPEFFKEKVMEDALEGDECYPVPFIGEPGSLGQLLSSSFPHLTNLTFEDVIIGNVRCEAILRSLRNHTHIKAIRVIKCFTDDELDSLASEISTEKGIEITLQHDQQQNQLHLTKETGRGGVLSPELMDALCHRTCVHDLYINGITDKTNREELVLDMNGREVDSKIHTFTAFHLNLQDNHSLSCLLGRFISLLPCLTELWIISCSFHDEFYKEIIDRASFSKIHTFAAERLNLQDNQSLSCLLGRFISLLPNCLTELWISCSFHDEFYKEIIDRASFSKIQTIYIGINCLWIDACKSVQVSAPASKQLAKFLCSLPCLEDLSIEGYHLHDDFYIELSSSPASSRIQRIRIDNSPNFAQVSGLASKQLAKFLCSLPCLQDLEIKRYQLHDDFFTELTSSPASSQNRCLKWMLEQWRRRQQLQLPPIHEHEHRPLSTERVASYLQQSAQSSSQYPSDHPRGIRSESSQLHQTLVHIPEPDELTKSHLQEFDQYLQSYISDQMQKTSNDQALQCTANSICHGTRQRSLHTGLSEATQDTSVGLGQRDAIQTQKDDTLLISPSQYINSCTSIYRGGHSIGMKPMYEYDDDHDRPSTSGFSSAYSRAGATPAYDDSTTSGRKRIYSDSDSDDDHDDDDDAATDGRPASAGAAAAAAAAAGTVSIAESQEHRPRKRLAKTDRNPTSP